MVRLIISFFILIHSIQAFSQQDNNPIIRLSNIRNAYVNHSISLMYPKINLLYTNRDDFDRQNIVGLAYSVYTRKATSRINWEIWAGSFGIYSSKGRYNLSKQKYNVSLPTLKMRIKPFIQNEHFEILFGVYYIMDLDAKFKILEANFAVPLGITFALGSNQFWRHINVIIEPSYVFGNFLPKYERNEYSLTFNLGLQINIFTKNKIFESI